MTRWRLSVFLERTRALLAAGLRDFLVGLYYLSPMYDARVGRALMAHRGSGDREDWLADDWSGEDRLQAPPPGHPEALATAIPLSAAERELWARLAGRRRRAGPPAA